MVWEIGLKPGRAFLRGLFRKRYHVWSGDFLEVFGMVSRVSRGRFVTETRVVIACGCLKRRLGSFRAHGVVFLIKSF